MPTRKIIETKPKTDRRYKAIRLWKRDFLDILDVFSRPDLMFEIEDDRHKYTDVADFFEHAPAHVKDFRITVTSTERNYRNEGVYLFLLATDQSIYINYLGDLDACKALVDRLESIILQCQKRFGLFLRSPWAILVWIPTICCMSLLLSYITLMIGKHLEPSAWQSYIIYPVLGLSGYFVIDRGLKTLSYCDLWIRANRGENTWWKRNRDKMEADLVKVIVSGVVGGIVGYLLPHH